MVNCNYINLFILLILLYLLIIFLLESENH